MYARNFHKFVELMPPNKVSAGVSGHLEFNSSFLNETKADLIATHAQARIFYWLPIAKVFFVIT